MIFFALQFLELPYLKLIGTALLLWIGIKLLVPESEGSHDNLVAVVGASNGKLELVIFGIVISIPIIIWGSKLVLHFTDHFPVVITFGAGLLGWIADSMAITDITLPVTPSWSSDAAGAVGVLLVLVLVLVVGKVIASRQEINCFDVPESERGERP
ncbi:hypothetical protein [Pseudomonas sp. NA-150]|uniref:TerC family protein n=1 Tax=Pseudomonas sp. NA-150 TaxID=3367525 RepID=UPI0037CAF008